MYSYICMCAKIYMHVKDFVVHVCESSVGYGNTRITQSALKVSEFL